MTEKEFTTEWIEKLKSGTLKKFPDEFIAGTDSKDLDLPLKGLLMGEELFGSYELIDPDGNSALVTDSYEKAKYILYSFREKSSRIKIPLDDNKTNEAVKLYEKHLDGLIREIEKDFSTRFSDKKNFLAVSNNIFNSLNLKRY